MGYINVKILILSVVLPSIRAPSHHQYCSYGNVPDLPPRPPSTPPTRRRRQRVLPKSTEDDAALAAGAVSQSSHGTEVDAIIASKPCANPSSTYEALMHALPAPSDRGLPFVSSRFVPGDSAALKGPSCDWRTLRSIERLMVANPSLLLTQHRSVGDRSLVPCRVRAEISNFVSRRVLARMANGTASIVSSARANPELISSETECPGEACSHADTRTNLAAIGINLRSLPSTKAIEPTACKRDRSARRSEEA